MEINNRVQTKIVLEIIIFTLIFLLGCSKTPHRYKNELTLDKSEFELTKDSLAKSLQKLHANSNELSYFSRSSDRKLRIDFIDLYLDSSQQKVLFTFIDSVEINFENVNLSKQSTDGNIYYPFVFKGVKNENNIWEIERIDGFNLRYTFSTDLSIKALKRFTLYTMASYTNQSGWVPYKYNIDDIRIFDGPLFQDSDSVRSGD